MFDLIHEQEEKSPTLTPRTTVYIIIPAETEDIDSDKLTKRGREQLDDLIHSRLITAISRIYSSPLKSALKTAGELRKEFKVPVEVIDDLKEVEIGSKKKDPHEIGNILKTLWEDHTFTPEGGESLEEARSRIKTCMNRIAVQHVGDSIAVITHPMIAVLFLHLVTGGIPTLEEWLAIGHASCATFEHQRTSWSLIMPFDNSFLVSPSTIEEQLAEEVRKNLTS